MNKEYIDNLEKRILQSYNDYWEIGESDISDLQYELDVKQLSELRPDSEVLIKINELPAIVQNPTDYIIHNQPMLSLDKVYSWKEALQWCTRVARDNTELFSIEPKFDGCAARLCETGHLATRGRDGVKGENITSKIPLITVESATYDGPMSQYTERNVRGEIIIRKSVFEQNQHLFLRKDGKPYKTERGASSGILTQKELNGSLTGLITFVAYNKYRMVHDLLTLRKMSWEYLISDVRSWDYPTDGLVIKLVDEEYSHSLGYTSHHPRGQIALKYGNPSARSKLLDVEWISGKEGITPKGIIEPVVIENAVISKVNLHNMKFIIDKNICINDEVIVERAGEIIPHVKKAIPGLDRKQISIELCPSCDSPISYEEPIIVCTNPNCSGRHFRRFRDCITRLEIKHISDGTIKKLLDVGIKDFIDVLDMSLNDFISLEGFGQKSGQRAFDEILKLKTNGIEDWRMISSLNIPGIGDTMCEKLMSLKTPEDLYNMSIEQLMELPNIGMVRAIQIYDNLRQQASYISRFLERVNIKITKGQGSFGEIAFTGSSSKSRTEWFRIAKSHNYTPIKSVTRTLKYLVTDDVNKSSVKMDKARKYSELHGLEIITYKQFEKLIS